MQIKTDCDKVTLAIPHICTHSKNQVIIMKLSRDEYARGLLRWDVGRPEAERVSVRTASSDTPIDANESGFTWSEWYTDPDGSKVSSQPRRYVKIEARSTEPVTRSTLERVVWEREQVTSIWPIPASGEVRKLSFVPDEGFFHRLVISVPSLEWPQDAVIRVDKALVRFVRGSVDGEHITPMEQVSSTETGNLQIGGGGVEPKTAEGRFIEIVAPGEAHEDATERAFGIWGLVAIAMGDQAVGDVVFSEAYEVNSTEQLGRLEIPVTAVLPLKAKESDIDTIDFILPMIMGTEPSRNSRMLALRWYQKGLSSSEPIERFFSFFIGIEAIVNSFARTEGPVPVVEERRAIYKPVLAAFDESIDIGDRALLLQRLTEATFMERFRFYVERNALDSDLVDKFRDLNDARRGAFHGSLGNIGHNTEMAARALLLRLLKNELGLLGKVPAEQNPRISTVGIEYALVDGETSPQQPTD